tara:strand:- start:35 stop:703 length:669 start_codon:yes stop_codon:yes gene_type:complete
MKNNIYQKLKNAFADSEMVEKAEKKKGMIYNPLLHDAVSEVAMDTLIKNNLYSYCTYEDTIIGDSYVGITCKMIVVDIDNPESKIEIKTSAIDKKDRYGLGGAMSYSRKYAFLSLLNLATGIKDDKEEAQDSETGYNAEPLVNKKKEEPKKKVDNLYIATKLDTIKNNKEKKDSSVLRSDIEKLKTEINQSVGWDAFTKTEQFKTFNALKNQITKQYQQRRS